MKTLPLPLMIALLLGCAAERPTSSAPTALAHDSASTVGVGAQPSVDAPSADAPARDAVAPGSAESPTAHAAAPSVAAVPVHRSEPLRLARADKVKGQRAWSKEGCDSCHEGGTGNVPRDKGVVRRIHNPLDSDEQVEHAMRAVRDGVNGRLSMPAHPRLDDATLLNLLAYARSLSEQRPSGE